MTAKVRALAAKCCFAVVDKGRSLADELPVAIGKVEDKDKGLLQELCYGVIRHLPTLEFIAREFIAKPLTGKQRSAHFLILVGIYQLRYTRIPDHAALSETVEATKPLKTPHLKGMINGVLRNVQRKGTIAKEDLPDAVAFNHPSWFIKIIKEEYPENWRDILEQNQNRPPMWLRVNQSKSAAEEYLSRLSEKSIDVALVESNSQAIQLSKPTDVNSLPGFEVGEVSVQDAAAQQAANLLGSVNDDRVLDCCAAPGGKTCHILEKTPAIQHLTAIDIEASRLERVTENLSRLGLSAEVIAADAAKQDWWDGNVFDRILLDAPCSGTGVIRRHPDIKWLRKASDIDILVSIQKDILDNCWSMLKPGGTLVYATCSILPQENRQQIEAFMQRTSDATLVEIEQSKNKTGWQILPGEQGMDGFYYAKLIKKK